MARSAFPGVIGVVFANQRDRAPASEHQESKARDFQPELVSNSGKMLQRSPGTAHHSAKGPAALHVLPCYPGGYSEFVGV